jgi:endonuclease/exonuclease/phosphatase family metal-dependent hydrolase
VLHSQLADIQERLGLSWDHIGNGREDGDQAGEYSPIFYRADRWVCERSWTFWLSPTPHVPSRGWDAALKRIVTMDSFRHRETGTVLVLMSTHPDHRGVLAREESSRLLLELARSWTEIAGPGPHPSLFLGGDFNSTPTDKAYRILTKPGSGMSDISGLVAEDAKYGNREITYTSFGNRMGNRHRSTSFLHETPRNLCFRLSASPPTSSMTEFTSQIIDPWLQT